MKIHFVLPYQKLKGEFYTDPLGVLYLVSIAKKSGHFCSTSLANWADLSISLREHTPDILAFSSTTGAHNTYLFLARKAKSIFPHLFTIFGGPHPTFFPEFIMEDGVDAICLGEGEGAFLEFINLYERKNDITQIHNIWVKSGEKIYKNPVRPLIEDLDTIPFPDRSIMGDLYQRSTRYVMASRGCSFDCPYCFNHAFRKLYSQHLKQSVRYRSVDNVIEELAQIKKDYPNTQAFSFVDDTFNLNKRWVIQFCQIYLKEIGLPFSCLCRVDLMDQDIANKLANAGCTLISVGIESGNDLIRSQILKRDIPKQKILDGCQAIRNAGISLKTFNMLGVYPGNFEDDLETVKLNIQIHPDIPSSTLFTPFPMTELGDEARKKGYWIDEQYNSFFSTFSWEQLGEKSRILLNDRAEIETLQVFFWLMVIFPVLYEPIKAICYLAEKSMFVESVIQSTKRLLLPSAWTIFTHYSDWLSKQRHR